MVVRKWWLLLCSGFILGLNFFSLKLELYHQGLGVDLLMHFVAGVLGASAVLYLLQRDEIRGRLGKAHPTVESAAAVGCSSVIALLWELYEYLRWQWYPETYLYYNSNADSLSDQALALLGGIAVGVLHLWLARDTEKR